MDYSPTCYSSSLGTLFIVVMLMPLLIDKGEALQVKSIPDDQARYSLSTLPLGLTSRIDRRVYKEQTIPVDAGRDHLAVFPRGA